ncbi:MAG: hypothetical protein NVSMB47_08290 [Polyangiales bacterium]
MLAGPMFERDSRGGPAIVACALVAWVSVVAVACSGGSATHAADRDSAAVDDGGPGTDADGSIPPDSSLPDAAEAGNPPVCAAYAPPALGKCATERWAIKVGDDYAAACAIDLSTATATTIGALISLPKPAVLPPTTRLGPTETTLYVLRDVTLVQLKLESDRDYHLVLADGTSTMIGEIPDPGCVPRSSRGQSLIPGARAAIDARYSVMTSFSAAGTTVSVKGIGFFDTVHGQTGVAINGIELHPVLGICFGAGCVLD